MQISHGMVRARGSEATRFPARSRQRSTDTGQKGIWVVALCAALVSPSAALAEIGVTDAAADTGLERAASPQPGANPPKVDLGRLLKLPDSYRLPSGNRRGVKRSEWENRFEVVRLDLSSAVKALAKSQSQLAEAAGGSSAWAVAAPGATPNPENTPLSYKLRQEIRRHRELIERSERTLRALEIEADLADVPEQWRASDVAVRPGN